MGQLLHLYVWAELVEKTSGRPAWAYAKMALGDKIGAPHLFGDGGGGFNTAGYYKATCRDMAKVAQIFINKGAWPVAAEKEDDGTGGTGGGGGGGGQNGAGKNGAAQSSQQLLSPQFAQQALSAAYPALNQAHGFATWLHGEAVPVAFS
jgi:CubicO group peptidase (beta-lactamase class C family)